MILYIFTALFDGMHVSVICTDTEMHDMHERGAKVMIEGDDAIAPFVVVHEWENAAYSEVIIL